MAEPDDKGDILEDIEIKLSKMVAEQNRDALANEYSTLNITGMWAIKKKVFPKNPPSKLFKPWVIGDNLFKSLLIFFKRIKSECCLTKLMPLTNIIAV